MNYPDTNAMDTSRLPIKERDNHIKQEHITQACSKHVESLKPGLSEPETKQKKQRRLQVQQMLMPTSGLSITTYPITRNKDFIRDSKKRVFD